MVQVVFFEKPGCANNTLQKTLLSRSGHHVDARNILTESWTPQTLRPFFENLPVAEWFNRSAPRVKSGIVRPGHVDEATALALMCADPLLIRRPLLEAEGRKTCGFHAQDLRAWIGLSAAPPMSEDCPRHDGNACLPLSRIARAR